MAGPARDPVSERLAAMAARLHEYRHRGIELAPLAVESICAALDYAAADALALEAAADRPPPARDGGANVVRLFPVAGRGDARRPQS